MVKSYTGGDSRLRKVVVVAIIFLALWFLWKLLYGIFMDRYGLERHIYIFISLLVPLFCAFLLSEENQYTRFKAAILLFLLGIFWIFEIFFANFYVATDTTDFTYASRKWFRKYWKPVNAQGYRDAEFPKEILPSERGLLVVGDSFTAGAGIKYAEDRFSNRLAAKLGQGWRVMNVGVNGAQTSDELSRVEAFPLNVSGVVLGYYLNDITGVLGDEAPRYMPCLNSPPFWARIFVNNSAMVNFLYWRAVVRWKYGHSFSKRLYDLYEDPRVWGLHKQEIERFARIVKKRGAFFNVVVFPNLSDVRGTETIAKKVASAFRSEGADVIEVSELFRDKKPSDLMVNSADAHPNPYVHGIVADLLYERIKGK